jgi:hypothetical protein
MAPYGARWMYFSLGTSDASWTHVTLPRCRAYPGASAGTLTRDVRPGNRPQMQLAVLINETHIANGSAGSFPE